jgi:hypothetical protein
MSSALSKKDRQKLMKVDKNTKWSELKGIVPIKETLEDLDIWDERVELLCSRYLNEAGKTGDYDEDEMFRQCREANKVKKKVVKQVQREGKKGAKGRGGGGGVGNQGKLTQEAVKKKEEEEKEKKRSDTLTDLVSAIAGKVFGGMIEKDGDIEEVLKVLKEDEGFVKAFTKLGMGAFFQLFAGILTYNNYMSKDTAEGVVVVSSTILGAFITGMGFLWRNGMISDEYKTMVKDNFWKLAEYIKSGGKNILEAIRTAGNKFWNFIKEMLGWLKKKSKDLADAFSISSGDDDDDPPPSGQRRRSVLNVDMSNEELQQIQDYVISQGLGGDPPDPPSGEGAEEEQEEAEQEQAPATAPESTTQQTTTTAPAQDMGQGVLASLLQNQQANAVASQKSQLMANQLAVDSLLTTANVVAQPAKKAKREYSDTTKDHISISGKKYFKDFNANDFSDGIDELKRRHPDKYGDWTDEKFKQKYDQAYNVYKGNEIKNIINVKPPEDKTPLTLPTRKENDGKPDSYWSNFANFGDYMPSMTSLAQMAIATPLAGYGLYKMKTSLDDIAEQMGEGAYDEQQYQALDTLVGGIQDLQTERDILKLREVARQRERDRQQMPPPDVVFSPAQRRPSLVGEEGDFGDIFRQSRSRERGGSRSRDPTPDAEGSRGK